MPLTLRCVSISTYKVSIYGARKETSADAIKTLIENDITVFNAAVVFNELATYKSFKVTIPADQRVPHAYLPSGPKEYVYEFSFIPLNKLVPIMEIKMGSYNCRGLNVSTIPAIKDLLNDCDVLLIQETWLLPHELKVFSKYLIVYNRYGVSGMNSEVLYHGRPFGGCSVLFNSVLSHCIDIIDLICKRLCCIKLRTPSYELYVLNVYLPCDTNNENDSYDYNEVLSIIFHYCCNNNQVTHRIIAGDLNIDFTSLGSKKYYQFEAIPRGGRYVRCIRFVVK